MEQQRDRNRRRLGLVAAACVLFTSHPLRAEEKSSAWWTLGGRNITEADMSTINNGQTARTMHNQVYQARKQALDAFITDQLLEQEAKKRGIPRDQLIKQ